VKSFRGVVEYPLILIGVVNMRSLLRVMFCSNKLIDRLEYTQRDGNGNGTLSLDQVGAQQKLLSCQSRLH
jgi:hypothetical protein